MGFPTRVFDLFYKRLGPTGSLNGTRSGSEAGNGIFVWQGRLPEYWFTSSVSSSIASSQGLKVSHSFLNFPADLTSSKVLTPSGGRSGSFITTRDSSSNASYLALPWGSHAADFLWNVQIPSWSFREFSEAATVDGGLTFNTYYYRQWDLSYTSKSFHKANQPNGSSFGVASYPITSSWRITDPRFANTASFNYVHAFAIPFDAPLTSSYPVSVGATYTQTARDSASYFAYDISFPNITNGNSTSSIDGQYFDLGGGALISRASVSNSLSIGSTYYNDDTATGLKLSTEALKARRLYFPTPVSQSGQSTGTDYWLKSFTGYKANDLFTDNGGIYNVQFTLKKQVALDSYPDNNTFMSVFIHNIIPQIPSSSARVPGALGWYPPENNIVRVGNGYGTAPAISFYDIQTGYAIEKFNINVIQYGYPAQLCIEVSGSLADNAYFGIIVDDIQMCKIGITTDPRFIKPYSLTQTVQNTSFAIGAERGGGDAPIESA